ncbi:amidohydrolase family protein [Candidatus Poribacteria bacterium]|nr:amidohydrolase family protein [Candidatus Poribacteria bacterium]
MNYDIAIENGWLVDGISNSVSQGSIGVVNGQIDCIVDKNTKLAASKVIDASHLIVSPGFIDTHAHSDQHLLFDPVMENKLLQGVTTEIGGNCGSSAFPWTTSNLFYSRENEAEFNWSSFDGFLSKVQSRGIALNYGSMIGHNSLHYSVGLTNCGGASREQLDAMRKVVMQAMDEGAFGLSSGMNLLPASLDLSKELIELSKIVARKDGLLSVHLRNESDDVLNALSEVIMVGIQSKVPVEVSHFKVLDRMNWPKQRHAMSLLNKMRNAGVQISLNFFPYSYVCAPLKVILPQWTTSRGSSHFVKVCSNVRLREQLEDQLSDAFPANSAYRAVTIPRSADKEYRQWSGMDLLRIARATRKEPSTVLAELALAGGVDRFVYYECINGSNIEEIAKASYSIVASDSYPIGDPRFFKNSIIHPRTFGTFPEFLHSFVYSKHLLSLPEAIRKITSIPASRFGIKRRGYLAKDAFADITIFDPEALESTSDINRPRGYPKGVRHVIVNGEVVIEEGEYAGKLPGVVLRRNA